MTLFDTLRHDGKAEELFNKFPKQQNGSSFLIRAASLHALAQFDQRLVEALDAEQAQPRILDFDSHSRAHLAWEVVVFARSSWCELPPVKSHQSTVVPSDASSPVAGMVK